VARQIDDDRALSYAEGHLGGLYAERGRRDEALYLTRRAIAAGERAEAADALYRWHWQAGRLAWQQGDGNAALASYRRAVQIVEETRQESLARYGASAAYFRQAVAPVYVDLVNALLQGAGRVPDPTASERLLAEALGVLELFRAAELRDYFRDECVVEFEARARPLGQVSDTAAIVYPIPLPDRLELLVGLPGGRLERFSVDVPGERVARTARRLREALQHPAPVFDPTDSETLYGWLVAPYAEALRDAGVDTLVFVPDGALRAVPMTALHDGEGFLVERYAVVVTPGLSLPDPQPFDGEGAHFLLAGVSESVQNFEALPAVPGELEAIQALYGGEVMLDAAFATRALEQEVETRDPSVVHLATHAVFRGDPSESFLLTYDGRLTMDRLGELVGRTRYRERPLELLMLSACETAAGDERAALGLSGVAVRAGARSAVGSLWSISDEAAQALVVGFYGELKGSRVSKAEALRRAQQALLDDPRYAHPFYWSPFLLIGNWL
jgi:CHAT domain-containing protein